MISVHVSFRGRYRSVGWDMGSCFFLGRARVGRLAGTPERLLPGGLVGRGGLRGLGGAGSGQLFH